MCTIFHVINLIILLITLVNRKISYQVVIDKAIPALNKLIYKCSIYIYIYRNNNNIYTIQSKRIRFVTRDYKV